MVVLKASDHTLEPDIGWPVIARILSACTAVALFETPPASWKKVLSAFGRIWEFDGKLPAGAKKSGRVRMADRLVTFHHELDSVLVKHVHSKRRDEARREVLAALKRAGLDIPA